MLVEKKWSEIYVQKIDNKIVLNYSKSSGIKHNIQISKLIDFVWIFINIFQKYFIKKRIKQFFFNEELNGVQLALRRAQE